ncbi:SDR family oxidoreductase [Microbacterium sp. NPDC089695]|uniref:SDR family oxidoreductase n=1 Tax=Microbacterium sp. NPDC089695 TaxID=3364198 RepID=UPI0037FE5EAB
MDTTESGRTALVVGASADIASAVALKLSDSGMTVGVHLGHRTEAAAIIARKIEETGGRAFPIVSDLHSSEGMPELWKQFDRHARHLDVLVSHADTTGRRRALIDVQLQDLDEVFDANVRLPFLLVQHALARLRDHGRIIHVASRYPYGTCDSHLLPYAMSKAAMDAFTTILAPDLRARGITVNSVGPRATRIEHVADTAAGLTENLLEHTADPDDVAEIVAFFASDDARWITGQWLDATSEPAP